MSNNTSVDHLLRPRVVVENKWPGCQYTVGDILIKDGKYYWVVGDTGWYSKVIESDIEPYPYLMRPLSWWEHRKPEEMPEYVKLNADGCSLKRGTIYQVFEWGTYPDEGRKFGNEGELYAAYIVAEDTRTHDKGEMVTINVLHLLPVTQSQYDEYLKTISNVK